MLPRFSNFTQIFRIWLKIFRIFFPQFSEFPTDFLNFAQISKIEHIFFNAQIQIAVPKFPKCGPDFDEFDQIFWFLRRFKKYHPEFRSSARFSDFLQDICPSMYDLSY